jgi:hypothetical protein
MAVAVLPRIVIVFALPVDETFTFGGGARLGVLLNVLFAEVGGIKPEAPVEVVVAVEPPVE